MNAPQRCPPGFTLIELLVVLLILALSAGAIVINLFPSRQSIVRDEAEHLREVLLYAGDFSRLSSIRVSWVVTQSGYRFEYLNRDGRWIPIDGPAPERPSRLNSPLFRPHTMKGEARIDNLRIDNQEINPPRLIFNPSGINDPFVLSLHSKDQPAINQTLKNDPLGNVFLVTP